jgi:hypothetical protein
MKNKEARWVRVPVPAGRGVTSKVGRRKRGCRIRRMNERTGLATDTSGVASHASRACLLLLYRLGF